MRQMIGIAQRGASLMVPVILLGRILQLGRDRRGVAAVEYGIVAAFLCLALLSIFKNFGTTLTTLFTKASSSL